MKYFEDLMWLFTSNESSRGIVRLNIAEGALLYKYCRIKPEGTLLEIGRKHGGSTVIMASALTFGRLFSIDIVDHSEVKDNIKEVSSKIILLTGDSKEIEWDITIDLLFIDGDHSFRGVQSDVRKFTPFIKPNGYLILHDAIGKKSELKPIIKNLKKQYYKEVDSVDSMLVLQKIGE